MLLRQVREDGTGAITIITLLDLDLQLAPCQCTPRREELLPRMTAESPKIDWSNTQSRLQPMVSGRAELSRQRVSSGTGN